MFSFTTCSATIKQWCCVVNISLFWELSLIITENTNNTKAVDVCEADDSEEQETDLDSNSNPNNITNKNDEAI